MTTFAFEKIGVVVSWSYSTYISIKKYHGLKTTFPLKLPIPPVFDWISSELAKGSKFSEMSHAVDGWNLAPPGMYETL